MLVGLAVHTILDGMALAASVAAESHGDATATGLFGFGTFLAVALHKPVDSMSIISLMRASGSSKRTAQYVNVAYALMCPLGAGLFWLGVESMPAFRASVTGAALAFSAGLFLAISLCDLLPEIQFHSPDKWKLSAALVAGVIVSYIIGFFEPPHSHDGPGHGSGGSSRGHDHHADHDHDHGHDHDSERSSKSGKAKARSKHDHDHDHSGHDHDK
jgi:zinc and cadmium transporter